jgi:predicted transposase YbfD/YdcC
MAAVALVISSPELAGRPAREDPLPQQDLSLPPLLPYLAGVEDPRRAQGRRYPLQTILGLICVALVSGINGYLPGAEWARRLPREEQERLGFRNGRTPAASTLYEVLRVLPWESLEAQIRAWMAELWQRLGRNELLVGGDPRGLAIDGKTMRGSWRRGAEVAHMLAAVGHQLALTLGQERLARKQGELTGIHGFLRKLLLDGLVVTVDAQFTHPRVAEAITAAGGDYVMIVKNNRRKLLGQVQHLLSLEAFEEKLRGTVVTHEDGHGRIEERQLVAHALQPGNLDWPGAKQVFTVISHRMVGDKAPSRSQIYGVTSLSAEEADPTRLLRLYRGHWTVENRAFWVRDVVMGEDRAPIANGNITAVMATLRGAALNLLRTTPGRRIARKIRQLNADRDAAFRLVGFR